MTKRQGEFITFPDSREAANIADRIEASHGYPQTFGAIDGSHIAVTAPREGLADYQNRKRYPSIILQALVDDWYMFRDISCKCPGSMHDASVYRNSSLFQRVTSDGGMPIRDRLMNEIQVPLHIIGDPAYPLSKWLIKGYVGRNLPPDQESVNVYLSSARMMVENAFGRLKGRWRMIAKKVDTRIDIVPYVVTTCCCLHNICEELKTEHLHTLGCSGEITNNYPQPEHVPDVGRDQEGSSIRESLRVYLLNTQPIRQSQA